MVSPEVGTRRNGYRQRGKARFNVRKNLPKSSELGCSGRGSRFLLMKVFRQRLNDHLLSVFKKSFFLAES